MNPVRPGHRNYCALPTQGETWSVEYLADESRKQVSPR